MLKFFAPMFATMLALFSMPAMAAVTATSGAVTLDFATLTTVIDTNAPLAITFMLVLAGVNLAIRYLRRGTRG